jgi:hypothetical protein
MRQVVTPGNARWASLSLALAVAAAIFLAFVPATSSVSVEAPDGDGPGAVTRSTHTLLESEGPSVLVVLAVPVLIAAAGLAAARRSNRIALTALTAVYGLGVLLALTSIGLFFAPSLIALVLALAAKS